MWSRLDYAVRGIAVVPLVVIGLAFTYVGGAFIQAGAWLADVETKDFE